MIIGDFNAKVGPRQEQDIEAILGLYGSGIRNERGTRLLQFAFGQSIFIANGLFNKKPQRRWTWISPNNIVKNEIDYVLVSDKQIIKDVGVINKIKYSSDHRPLRAKIKFNFKIHRAKAFKTPIKKLNKETLINNYESFNLELANHFKSLDLNIPDVDVDEQHDNIIAGIRKSSSSIKTEGKKNTKLTTSTRRLLEQRSMHGIGSELHRLIDKQVKKAIRTDIRNLNTHLVEVALQKHRSLRVAKQGISRTKPWINSLLDTHGTKHNNRQKIIEICTEFYSSLYSDNSKLETENRYSCSEDIPPITGYEVDKVLKTMHYDRSPGEDGVTSETLKLGSATLLPHLTNLFNAILQAGKLPTQMCHSNIVLLHKKGDKCNINNYRPISLVSHIYKAFIKVIHNRIDAKLDSHQPPEQAGFRPSFSTTDHLQTLNQLVEKHSEFQKPLYLAFVDYTKAFDSIQHSAIFSALRSQDVEETYIELLKNIYNNSTANVKLDSVGTTFKINKGVKQGDPLSPKLFTSTLEEVFKKLADAWATKGIQIGDKMLTNLRFADDIVLFASTADQLQQMLQELSTASLEVGLTMNRSKTKVMTNAANYRVEVDGQEIQYVDEYIYLGQLVSFHNRQDKEIDRRVENAWRSYWSMKALMKGDLPISLKRKLVDMCILPILTYGAQTWSLTEAQKSKLKICQRAMERSILKIKLSDQIRNTTIRSKTGVADVGDKSARLKWDWAGHTCRMHESRWARIVTQWVPDDGRRRRGRPKKRWRDDLDSFLTDWPEKAQHKEDWKNMGETFAQQWDNIG